MEQNLRANTNGKQGNVTDNIRPIRDFSSLNTVSQMDFNLIEKGERTEYRESRRRCSVLPIRTM